MPKDLKKVSGTNNAGPELPLATRIKKHVQQTCPGATDIQVQVQAKQKLRIDLRVGDQEETRAITDRIFSLSDLQAYEVELHIIGPQK